jgi:hypothetical protein
VTDNDKHCSLLNTVRRFYETFLTCVLKKVLKIGRYKFCDIFFALIFWENIQDNSSEECLVNYNFRKKCVVRKISFLRSFENTHPAHPPPPPGGRWVRGSRHEPTNTIFLIPPK